MKLTDEMLRVLDQAKVFQVTVDPATSSSLAENVNRLADSELEKHEATFLKLRVAEMERALEKIASGWIDPVNETDCKNCDMGLYKNLGHAPECVFEIAREALATLLED